MVSRHSLLPASLVCLFASVLPAQQNRIHTRIDRRDSIAVRGSVPAQALPERDAGRVEPDFRLGNITILLRPAPAQQADLEKLLAEQQDPASPNYHNWLTPESYADRFGASAADMDQIAAWLRSEGFDVKYTSRGRDFISFSGTAGQAESAFHTQIHRYRNGAELHFANAADVSLPSAIAPIVSGVLGLHDFHPRAPRKQTRPQINGSDGSHAMVPDDFATIYNLTPLYHYGYTGDGQSVVIVGQSDIDRSDIDAFRDAWGLPPANLQIVSVGAYPGITDDASEADLDLEWSGAVARTAKLIYVFSDDANYSAYYAIDNNLAPVISESFGLCEYQVGINRLGLYNYQPQAQKAVALGITWLVSSGDSGAAGCDYRVDTATKGLGVSLPASIPEVTAVGGTGFNEGSGNYWSAANAPYFGSALSYIPEVSWNDTSDGHGLASSGGGASSVYTKPSWQTGPGVPADGARDVPDISLAASAEHDPYLAVIGGDLFGIGGTSASAPAFAGIVAVLNQFLVQNQVQAKPGLGNMNPKLYSMAASGAPGVFHDITSGDNIVPCQDRSIACATGKIGYKAGVGYDPVTGLGSVDAFNFITAWAGIPVNSTTMTLTVSPGVIASTGSAVVTATVKAASGSRSATGPVIFTLGDTLLGSANLSGTGGTATASITVFGGQLSAANNTIKAVYAGSPTFTGSSATAGLSIGTPKLGSAVTLTVTPNPVIQHAADANGATFSFTIQLKETAGVPTTLTGFSFGGVSYTLSIPAFFGSTSLPALGTLSAPLSAKNFPTPSTQTVVVTGQDASGATWSKQVTVTFLAK